MNEADMKLAGDLLQIKLKPKHLARFWQNVLRPSDDACWEWQKSTSLSGYGQVQIRPKKLRAHRISFVVHNLHSPEMILHLCDNRKCVNPKHLRAGNHADNMADMTAKKRQAFGKRHGSACLSDDDVLEIRRLYYSGVKVTIIAGMFKVSNSSASRIARGLNWQHLPNAQLSRKPNSGKKRKLLPHSQK